MSIGCVDTCLQRWGDPGRTCVPSLVSGRPVSSSRQKEAAGVTVPGVDSCHQSRLHARQGLSAQLLGEAAHCAPAAAPSGLKDGDSHPGGKDWVSWV